MYLSYPQKYYSLPSFIIDLSLIILSLTDSLLQVAFLCAVAGWDWMESSIVVEPFGPVHLVIDVVSDLLQVLEVRPIKRQSQ